MSGYGMEVSCPQCAGPVGHVNSCTTGNLAVTIVECQPCQRQWELTVRIVQHAKLPAKAACRA